jgi:hypothetical protein
MPAHAWDHLPGRVAARAAIAKAHITARASEVARAAVELHGGIGFTWECDVQLWFKRAMFDRTVGRQSRAPARAHRRARRLVDGSHLRRALRRFRAELREFLPVAGRCAAPRRTLPAAGAGAVLPRARDRGRAMSTGAFPPSTAAPGARAIR